MLQLKVFMKRLIVLFCFLIPYSGFSQDDELERLVLELTFKEPDSAKVKMSSRIIQLLYNAKKYNQALKYIIKTEELSQAINYKKGLAEMIYFKALIYNKKEDYINATRQFIRAKNIFGRLKDTIGLAKIRNQLGTLEIERGNYKKGLKYALNGIKELEKRGLKEELVTAYKNIAMAYEKTNTIEKAINFNLKSLEIERELNNVEGLINSYKDLARLHCLNHDFNKSILYYEKAINHIGISEANKAKILPELGDAYFKIKDYKSSAKYLVQSIKLNRKLKNDNGIIKSLNNLGALNLEKSRYKTAERQLLEAGSLGRTLDNKKELLKNYSLMKTLDSTRGDFEGAFAWQSQYHKIKSLLDAEAPKFNTPIIIEEPIVKIPDIKRSNEISNENNDAQKTLDKYKLIFYALLAAFALVSIFFILLFLKRNNSIKYTKDLEAKNQKIELQNVAILEQSKHLENINKVKDKLFSIVSHDLKDSLTSTKGFIDLLKEGQLSHEEFHSLLPELSENANNASLLLFNLLNWSKSQMQSLKPKPALFNIQEVFYEKVKLVEQKMQTKDIVLVDKTLRDFVYADRSMVEIIIQNLLANAVKFCDSGDKITIANTINDGKSIISVSDSGVGISVENQHKLFDNNTFSTVGTNNEKGTGLGLTICREFVELNAGKIWVDSELNVGSTFFIELPKVRVKKPVNT